jgi:uncharacterized protein involved in exopolysaccharide biosynthesis
MNESMRNDGGEAGEITIETIVSRVWQRKWLVLLVALGSAAAAGIAALILPKTYVATSIIAPATGNNSGGSLGGLSSIASQFGGLASLAGINVGGDTKKYESVAVLQSEALTENFISSNGLLPILYEDDWDAAKNTWRRGRFSQEPTLWQANRYFKRLRTVSTDAKTGIITISIKWRDPKLAAAWTNGLVKLTNEYLRGKAIREADGNIAYLNEQATKTDIVAVKQGIYSMIQGEINKAMMAQGTNEFALKVLDPAIAPEKPSSPQLAIWVLAGFFIGSFIAAMAAFFLESRSIALQRG